VGGELRLDEVDVDDPDVGVADGDPSREGLLDVVAAPLVRLVLRALLRMHNAVTSGFAFGVASKVRVSRGLINPAYACVCRVRATRCGR